MISPLEDITCGGEALFCFYGGKQKLMDNIQPVLPLSMSLIITYIPVNLTHAAALQSRRKMLRHYQMQKHHYVDNAAAKAANYSLTGYL